MMYTINTISLQFFLSSLLHELLRQQLNIVKNFNQKDKLLAAKLPKNPNKFIVIENTAIIVPLGALGISIALRCNALKISPVLMQNNKTLPTTQNKCEGECIKVNKLKIK